MYPLKKLYASNIPPVTLTQPENALLAEAIAVTFVFAKIGARFGILVKLVHSVQNEASDTDRRPVANVLSLLISCSVSFEHPKKEADISCDAVRLSGIEIRLELDVPPAA